MDGMKSIIPSLSINALLLFFADSGPVFGAQAALCHHPHPAFSASLPFIGSVQPGLHTSW